MCDRKTWDIYIYKNANGKIVEIPAFIVVPKLAKAYLTRVALDRDNNHYLMEIGIEPGMVFNNAVWFREKNFEKAKNIFLSDVAEKLKKTEEERSNLRDQLSFLSDQKEA